MPIACGVQLKLVQNVRSAISNVAHAEAEAEATSEAAKIVLAEHHGTCLICSNNSSR